jgi:hypothetical protein
MNQFNKVEDGIGKKEKDYYWRWRFVYCMYELQYEWNCSIERNGIF